MNNPTNRILDDCQRYWERTGISHNLALEMRHELGQHLEEADADGRSVESVTGSDVARFAEEWAEEHRSRPVSADRWRDIKSGAFDAQRSVSRSGWLYGLGAIALIAGVVVGSMISEGGPSDMDMDAWRWFWTGLAVVAGIAEIFTAGFFLLPIAIGAIGGGILAWLGVDPVAQWLVFFGVTFIAFAYFRRFAERQDLYQPRVGANRWAGARGIVIETIDPDRSLGLIRVEGEEWRATSDGQIIEAGSTIGVREVRGSKMVVVKIEPQ